MEKNRFGYAGTRTAQRESADGMPEASARLSLHGEARGTRVMRPTGYSARTLDWVDQCADEEQRACLAIHNRVKELAIHDHADGHASKDSPHLSEVDRVGQYRDSAALYSSTASAPSP